MKIDAFNLPTGEIIAKKYRIRSKLGGGLEGEVYLIEELSTGILRAAKFYYPQNNKKNRSAIFQAKKMHALRHCPILVQYIAEEQTYVQQSLITIQISEYVEGMRLSNFLKKQPGKRLAPFQALHLLYALAEGIAAIHAQKDYHGDIHSENIMVCRYGLGFQLKMFDFFHYGKSTREHIFDDVVQCIQVFHEVLGGTRHYAKQPKEVKAICCGLKRSLIAKKFRHAGDLKLYLEQMEWAPVN